MIIRERIEFGLKSMKIAHGPSAVANSKIANPVRKESEVQVTCNIPHYDIRASPVPENSNKENPKMEKKSKQDHSLMSTPIKGFNQKKKVVHFTPIPMTYTELLPQLLNEGLVAICHLNRYKYQTLKTMILTLNVIITMGCLAILHKGVWHSNEKCNRY